MPETKDLFENIAKVYDPLNTFFSMGFHKKWKTRLISEFKGAKKLLDLATGTSDVSINFIEHNPDSMAVGLDPSINMLLESKKKLKSKNLTEKIFITRGIAEDLPFNDGTFDAVTISFGIRNTVDPQKSLNEMHRVLNEKGSIGILEFSLPRNKVFGPVYMTYLNKFFPLIGSLFGASEEYRYLGDSISKFPNRSNFISLMETAGFKDCRYEELNIGTVIMYRGFK
ncbi:MAG: ubiquinone/menaquinone biosynthesis methyltransferase [Candidatus Dadabacteria bacterium]|nr:ubiquinone/menaquinone biosynthesis methyltransferase [Candidatus Dadabacteria bacterium]NIQ15990.1 ubiquinone/menaquinone biosynthesis methyltransferase [Candidatus Dadabacteria bacterium]